MESLIAERSDEYQKELAALARMVTYARQTANDLNVSLPTYFLDMALASILDELKIVGVDTSIIDAKGAGQSRGCH